MTMDLPERVAIAFVGASLVATLGLGGAVAFELGTHASGSTQVAAAPLTGGAGADASTPTPSAAGGSGPVATAGATTAGGNAASSGGGGASAARGAPVALSNKQIGVSNGVITVGGMYDETTVLDATVERDTVRAYFNMVNAQGGVNGYKFQLVDCDSAYDPTRGHQCSQQLLSSNILAMVGSLSASSEQPEVPYLTSHGLPVIGGLGVPSEFGDPLSYPVSIDLAKGATGEGYHAGDLKTLDGGPIKFPGVVLLKTNFTDQIWQYLEAALKSRGITKSHLVTVDATKADYTDTVIDMRGAGVDSIIGGLDPFSYGRLFQAMERQSYSVKFLGSGLDKASAAQQYGNHAYATSESLTPLIEPAGHENQPAVAEYLNTVKKYYPGQVPALDVYSEGSWVAAKIFVEAIRRIGSQPVTRQSLVNALNSIKNFQTGLTVPLSYAPGNSHDPNGCLQWIRRSSGTWETYSDWKCF
jgi:ABC-type branched-subunit amino acid transport system substrate-binding protein